MSASVARVAAQAKLNLGLRVLARERGGFHTIETLFVRIALADVVTVRVHEDDRTLLVTGADTGPTEENLAFRAAAAYAAATGWPRGFAIEVEKKIPAGAGLGGGSADAGAVLRALNALAPEPVSDLELFRIGLELGSDVPYLTSIEALALAWGRGERMIALPALPERTALLVLPGYAVSTATAYGWLAASRPVDVPSPRLVTVPELTSWESVARHVVNDFEPVVAAHHPEMLEIIAQLRGEGATIAGLTGSGSALFGILPLFADTVVLTSELPGIIIPTRTVTRVARVELVE
jgi:4-diphosphocytidyl-2-C-methyl-D-erythritol kinase